MTDQTVPAGLTVDNVTWTDGNGVHLEARRQAGDAFGRGPIITWVVRVDLDLGVDRRRYEADNRRPPVDMVHLEGCGDDLQAVHAGLAAIGGALARFTDRLHVARLSVLGELGDAPKIALRSRADWTDDGAPRGVGAHPPHGGT